MLAADASWEAAEACLQTHGRFSALPRNMTWNASSARAALSGGAHLHEPDPVLHRRTGAGLPKFLWGRKMSLLDQVLDLAALDGGAIPAHGRQTARFSLFDWMVCGLAGVDEPLSGILREVIGGRGWRAGGQRDGRGHDARPRGGAGERGRRTRWIMTTRISPMSGIRPWASIRRRWRRGEMVGASGAQVADAFLIGARSASAWVWCWARSTTTAASTRRRRRGRSGPRWRGAVDGPDAGRRCARRWGCAQLAPRG